MNTLISPFVNIISFFTWLVPGHNLAWGIILLTLLVRLILIVPSRQAARAQRKQAQLQPLLEELKAEYGEDRQALAVAQMELFKKNGVNPFGACVPILIQLPLMIVLYQAIRHGFSPTDPDLYGWIPRPPFIITRFFWTDLLHPDPYYILPALAALMQFLQMRMTLPTAPVPQNATADSARTVQKQMMIIMPLVYFAITRAYPSGAGLYLVITTLFSVCQQYLVNRETLRLQGVEKQVEKLERLHPEDLAQLELVKGEVLGGKKKEVVESTSKKGVSVTVRKRSK